MIRLNALSTDDILSGLKQALDPKGKPGAEDLEKYIAEHKFDRNKIPPEDSHIFFYNGIPIGSRGNIIAVTGKAKSRKTVVASAVASSCFIEEGGFIGFTSDLEPEEPILHMDTEQGYYHYYGSVSRIFNDAGIKQGTPERFHSIHTRDATVELRIELLEYLMEKIKPTVVILDGVTDFVRDINNQDQATDIAELLLYLSYKYNALILVVIHTTKTTGYMTGAVGTTLEKKAQTVIKVEKDEEDEDVSHVSCQYARDRGFKSFSIKYVEELGRYDSLGETATDKKGKKGDKRPEGYAEDIHDKIVTRMFGYSQSIPGDQLQQRLVKAVHQVTGDRIYGTLIRAFIKFYNESARIFANPEGAWMRPAPGATSNHAAPDLQTGLFTDMPATGSDSTTDDLPF